MSDPSMVIAVGLLLAACGAPRPSGLGVHDGRLAPCPASPNCVSSQATDPAQRVDAIPYQVTEGEAIATIEATIRAMPRTHIVKVTDDYVHAEFTTMVFRFVDDFECLLDPKTRTIQIRSASRVGHSDFGVNRRRVETFRRELSGKLALRKSG